VLSPSTEVYDRGEKFSHYLQLDSLQEYVLVSQAIPRVEVYFRQPDGAWLFRYFVDLSGSATLRSVDIDLPLSEIYAGVEFESE
jgi:Uma2 family endonuclease